MRIQQFLEHHGIAANPFADEDAQTDLVFKGHCIKTIYHPSWDKIFGDPREPATSIVLGEKGSGKTAIGLQIVRHVADYNMDHPGQRLLVVQYDDFNPFLDRFRDRFSGRRRRIERALDEWRLWDHMDAILSLATTQLVDRLLGDRQARHPAAQDPNPLPVEALDRSQVRDVLLLAACYDQSTAQNFQQRWERLRRRLRFPTWKSRLDQVLGIAVTLLVVGFVVWQRKWVAFGTIWPYLAILAGWLPRLVRSVKWWWTARRIRSHTRVLDRPTGMLRNLLMRFSGNQLAGQPLPAHRRTDDRYALLGKLQTVLRTLGFPGILVVIDRLDEPYLINGSAELMRALLWPLLDNKFLKHPGIGLKILAPTELGQFIDRENRDFYERARLDKQNLIRSLDWTGQSLYDLADARIRACALEGQSPTLPGLFDETVDSARLTAALGSLRVPRHLAKFMYRLVTAHCHAHTEQTPVWRISAATFESVLAVYHRDQDAAARGLGTG
jgi:hypothetical protein